MNKIAQIFETLEYGPAPETPDQANAWLDSKNRKFGHFINGAWTAPGKTFASTGHEAGSFHVTSAHEEKAVLLETDPDAFWQTPHYANWPGLLVRYGAADAERIRAVIARAWWDRASKAQRENFGARP